MVTNKVFIRIIYLLLFGGIVTIILLTFYQNSLPAHYCYRYSLGRMRIENPILVSIDGIEYVCPDSVIKYCANKDWINRNDVYPYILIAESNVAPVFYPSPLHKTRIWDRHYYPFYKVDTTSQPYKSDTTIYRFYYNLHTFDAYMQSVNSYWYDPSDPNMIDPNADCYDAFAYSSKYRIAVRQHYTTWQIIKLRWHIQQKKEVKSKRSEESEVGLRGA